MLSIAALQQREGRKGNHISYLGGKTLQHVIECFREKNYLALQHEYSLDAPESTNLYSN